MTEDRDDPIIDALLEEVLGGEAPPDLSARIMQSWATRAGGPAVGQAAGTPPLGPPSSPSAVPSADKVAAMLPPPATMPTAPPPFQGPPVQSPPVQGPPVQGPPVQRAARPAKRSEVDRPPRWITIAVAAAVLLTVTALGFVAARVFFLAPGETPIAEEDGPAGLIARARNHGGTLEPSGPPSGLRRARAKYASQLVAAPRAEIVATVDDSLQRKWEQSGVTPAPPATDAEWVRRTHLRMLGRIPTVAEIETFEDEDGPATEKKAELLEELLVSDGFAQEHARTWTSYWTNVLIGRTGGTQEDSLVSREGLQEYLYDSLLEDKPFDQMVYELISATGSNEPGTDDFNGATNFMLSGIESNGALATAKTCRVFLGKQLQCAQCHDHPFDKEVKQQQFWELAAFLRQTGIEQDDRLIRLVDRDVFGPANNPEDVGIAFQGDEGAPSTAYPVFIDGTELPHSGRLAEANRRTKLAELVVGSPEFSRAIVNRTWAQILGRGFTWPVDDMGPHNEPSHPELLNYLADQFAANDYNFKELVRWISLSEVYSLSSQINDGNRADDPEITKAPLFSRYYARPMQPEEVYESLLALAGPQANAENFVAQEAAKLQWLGQFTIDLQTDDGSELAIFDASYTQKLEMLGGELMEKATDPENRDGVLHRVLQSSMAREEKVEHLFLASLARRPSTEELTATLQVIEDRPDDPDGALEDVWWALLNSSEFLLDR